MPTLETVANHAESTLTLPLTRRLPSDNLIAKSFEEFHAANPNVYTLLVSLARDVKRRGFKRYSMKAIWERARWHHLIDKGNHDFKLNNNYHAFYARLIMRQEPDLVEFFETREHKKL